MRLFLLFCLLLTAACSSGTGHGPVSAKLRRQLEGNALGRAEFDAALSGRSITPAGRIVLPFRMEDDAVPVLDAEVNGVGGVPFILDTGASATLLHAVTAARTGARLLAAEGGSVPMQGVIGIEHARIGLVNQLRLGGWTVEGFPCLVRLHENRVGFAGGSFRHNLLGLDLLRRHCSHVTLDFPARTVEFAFAGRFQPQPGRHVAWAPFTVRKGVPFITLGSGDHRWQAVVDTGSFNGIEISREVAERLGVADQGRPVEGLVLLSVGGTTTSDHAGLRTVRLPDLSLFGETWRSAPVDISPGPSRVGSFFLRDYRVTFDFPAGRIWLEH
jgi:predicted aspartyl protease